MKMIKVLTVLLVCVFLASSVYAGGGSACSTGGGKALSKVPGESSFNAASDHIACWGKSRSNARELSLRGQEKPAKRSGTEISVKN